MSFLGKMFAKKPVSTNQNFKLLNKTYTPQAEAGVGATNYLSSLLTGQGDVGAAQQGWQGYQNMAGYAPAMAEMTRGVTGTAAARGLLRSGSTGQAYLREGQKLNQQMFGNYLEGLGGLAGIGNEAGSIMANVGGGHQDSMRKSTAGTIGSVAGKALSLFGMSDRRLKEDIEQVGHYENGLPMYEFRYKGDPQKWRGVMADDVEKVRPETVRTTLDGFKAVNYSMLGIRMERV